IVRGPDGTLGPIVAAVLAAPGAAPGAATGPLYRIDWPAPVLARHRRRLPILATTVVLADAALLTLVLLYRRRRLRPIEGLIERARSVQSAQAAAGDGATRQRVDEVAQLLETFDRALGELARRGSEADPLSEAVRDSGGAGDGAEDGETSTGLLLVDAGGRFLALNEAGAHWLDVGIDVAGRAVEEVLERQPEVAAILEQALRTGQPVRRHECGVRTASGERRILGLTLTRLTRADGSPRGWLGLFTDLTHVQREHRESMLSTSLAQIAEMSAGLAHELRNGMASLRGYATLLARSDLGPRQAEDLAELQQEIDHLHRVAEDFLSFARPGTARLEDLDLVEVTRRAVADPALRGERVELELAGGGDGGTAAGELAVADEGPSTTPRTALRGDAQLIERLLRNLMSNAARSHRDLEPRPPIVVRVFAEPDEGDPRSSRPTVEVLDRGPGLPEAVRERLFTPFARGNEDGVGLGLALARRIADLHHAELTLEPRAGGGTRARLRFPPPAGSVG
ncbi:MAG: PAS domain S-box protein, partial [Acidobacteria bacterium]